MGGTVKKGLNSYTSAADLQPSEGTEVPIVPFLCAEQENDGDFNEPTQDNGSLALKQEHTCTRGHTRQENTLAEDRPANNFF